MVAIFLSYCPPEPRINLVVKMLVKHYLLVLFTYGKILKRNLVNFPSPSYQWEVILELRVSFEATRISQICQISFNP